MIGKTTVARLVKRPMTLGFAAVAQLVERVLGKDEVMGSSPISSFCAGKHLPVVFFLAGQTHWVQQSVRPALRVPGKVKDGN